MRTLAAACVLAVAAHAQSLADWVPESTVVFCELENLARTKERVQKSALNAAWNDPALAPFRKIVLEAWEEAKRDHPDGFHALSLLEGRVAFAAFDKDIDTMVLLAHLGDKAREFVAALERQSKQSAEKGVVIRRERIRGFEATVEYEEGDEPFGYFMHEDKVVLGDKPGLERFAAHLESGRENSLGRREAFRTVRARSGERPDLFVYVDLGALIREDPDRDELKMAGLDNLSGLGITFRIGGDGLHSRLFVNTSGEMRGVMKLLGAPNADLAPESFVPPQTSTYFTARFDVQRSLRIVLDILGEEPKKQLDELIRLRNRELGIDIEKDILGALGHRLSFFFVDTAAGENPFASIETSRVKGLLDTIDKLVPDLVKSDFNGVPLRSMGGPVVAAAPAGHLMGAATPEALRTVLLRYGKDLDGLAQTKEFRYAAERVPTRATLLYFSNPAWDRGPSAFMRGLAAGLTRSLIEKGGGDPATAALQNELWLVLGALKKYRDVHAWSLSTAEDGLLFAHFFGLKKPE